VLYPVAVHFKGSGFYTTDYGRGSGKKPPSKDGDSSSPDSKPDSKPKEEKKAAEA
jgi:predicted nucleic acid-binding Zn ribbon protein